MAVLRNRMTKTEEIEEKPIVNGVTGVTFSEEDSLGVISISGTIDDTNVEDVTESAIKIIEDENMRGLVFDAKDVRYISRAGITMFAKLNLKAGEYEKSYQIINLRADIAKVFQMIGYAAAFSITVMEEEA